jgi:hypothetical protein
MIDRLLWIAEAGGPKERLQAKENCPKSSYWLTDQIPPLGFLTTLEHLRVRRLLAQQRLSS